MSGLIDFLTQGVAPPATTSVTSSSTNLPDWYSTYLQGLMGTANQIAGEPYQAYSGPRIAPLTQAQTLSNDAAISNLGAQQPLFDAAGNNIQAAANAANSGASTAAAHPYATTASQTWPGAASTYMNPYMSNVTDEIARLGNQNLFQKVIPGIDSTFTSAGQFGSRRNAEALGQGIRDTQLGITGQQSQALMQGYNASAGIFNNDANRNAQLASTMGQLAGADIGRATEAGTALGGLGKVQSATNIADIAAANASGTQQQQQNQGNLTTAYNDFLAQRNYPTQQLGLLSNVIQGVNPGSTTTQTTTGVQPGVSYGASPLSTGLGALTLAGQISDLFKKKGGLIRGFSRGGPVYLKRGGPVHFRRGGLNMCGMAA